MDIFDVDEDRERLIARRATLWTNKRKRIDAELRQALDAALAEPDPCRANVLMRDVENRIRKRKIATTDAFDLRARARAYFGTDAEFEIIYADPPWRYESDRHELGTAKQYATMSLEELAAMPVAGLAAADSALVMWTTYHMLEQACSLFAAWGFEVKTVLCVWVKVDRTGAPAFTLGRYTMPCSELCLFGIRGSLRVMQRQTVVNSIVRARPRGHSRKPPEVRKLIVDLFGDLPRIELFARTASPDWHVWGNQTEHFANDIATDGATTGFIPRTINRRRQTCDRTYRIDVAGAANLFTNTTIGTSFGRLTAEFDADAEQWPDETHAHDGSRPCCRAIGELVPPSHLQNLTLITAYLTQRGGEEAIRHPLYTRSSVGFVRTHAARVRQKQRHNSDLLYALNHNKRAKHVRVAPMPQ